LPLTARKLKSNVHLRKLINILEDHTMADLIQESDVGIKLVIVSIQKFRKVHPKHPLLKFSEEAFATVTPAESRDLCNELYNRFWRREDPMNSNPGLLVTAVVFMNYHIVLERAVVGLEGDVGPESVF
jgi:hypothetical protein